MSPFIEDPPEWFKSIPPLPNEWGWRLGLLLQQSPGGVYQALSHSDLFRQFTNESVLTKHVRWFFDRGVYAIAQPREFRTEPPTLVHGLALYPLQRVTAVPDLVYHVAPKEKVNRIRDEGIRTGRHAGECTSSWKEAIDFVHVWRTREQALAWPDNRKLKAISSGPWSLVTLVPSSQLYEDPKSEPGGWIFGCDECVAKCCIQDVTAI